MDEVDLTDLDSVVPLKPSSQRVRNILTLEERVAAIQAYSARPMYTKVAKMFNCSWEQIKNIIANRKAILEFHEATKNATKCNNEPQIDWARKRKIDFLGECVYEYIQRLQYHNKVDLSEELIRCKALEFRDIIRIEGFVPNKAWINHFKATFNFSLSNRQLRLTRAPPTSLDLRDVMTYVTKKKSNPPVYNKQQPAQKLYEHPIKPHQHNHNQQQHHHQQQPSSYRPSTMLEIRTENEFVLHEFRQRQQRKLKFLERALLEYAQRSKFHLKVTLDDQRLMATATSLFQILKLEHFHPDAKWLKSFKARHNFDTLIQKSNLSTSTRTPPLSLDLRDILSYCSRMEKNSQLNGNANQMRNGDKSPTHQLVKLPTTGEKNGMTESFKDAHKPLQAVKAEVIDLAEEDEQQLQQQQQQQNQQTLKRPHEPSPESAQQQQPMLKIRKIESMCQAGSELPSYFMQNSPGHWSEPSDKDFQANETEEADANETQPKTVRSYEAALKLLKPLEEFAMLEENYRAIGLIEQLESLFKNPPKKEAAVDEEQEEEVDN